MPWKWAVALVVLCTVLNVAGFMWHFFEPIPLYDEIVHFITPFTLVALTAEIIYRAGGDDVFFNTPRHALITGSVIGLVGAVGWEVIEQILASAGANISNRPGDTVADILLGVAGGALGAWFADRYLDRLFGRPRWASHRSERVR
ncbi:MAG: hypothetical protein ACFB50_16605 [Rubrobacteraceae bacterium]